MDEPPKLNGENLPHQLRRVATHRRSAEPSDAFKALLGNSTNRGGTRHDEPEFFIWKKGAGKGTGKRGFFLT
jgi:hypothetical protein